MSLIVEDGTGLANAESYISITDASTYLANIGMTTWASITATEQEQALRRATTYMEQAYRENWKGYRLHKTQALSWPRWDTIVDGYPVDPNVVPPVVANACAQLAFKAAAGDLNGDLVPRVIRKKVGPIETEYDRYSSQATRFRSIDMMLAPFLARSGASFGVVRT